MLICSTSSAKGWWPPIFWTLWSEDSTQPTHIPNSLWIPNYLNPYLSWHIVFPSDCCLQSCNTGLRGKSLGKRYKEPRSGLFAFVTEQLTGSMHITALSCTMLHCTQLYYATLHCAVLCYTALSYTTLSCNTLSYTTLHCTELHYTELHYTDLHYTELHYTELHNTTLHYTVRISRSAPVTTGVFLDMKGSNVRCWHCTCLSVDPIYSKLLTNNNTVRDQYKGINVHRRRKELTKF